MNARCKLAVVAPLAVEAVKRIDVIFDQQRMIGDLVTRLEADPPRLIVLQASGGYERPAATALKEWGLVCCRG